ncbi:MAG: hypothetical protein LBQ43_03215 [Holosporales bacterium]|jgi:hypothetical protein|nr:hypothetical protein [Holosporales bacterium]
MPVKKKTDSAEMHVASVEMFAPEVKAPSPFFKVNSPPPKPAFAPLVMSNCFYKNSARADAMLILRMLANQNAKYGDYDGFMEQLDREISLKNGDFDAETMARDALINKYLK